MSSDLELPNWLPRILVEEARRIRVIELPPDAPNEAIELLRRLTSDYRMKRVWQELYKKNESSTIRQINTCTPSVILEPAE
jgi:hypothetical protein